MDDQLDSSQPSTRSRTQRRSKPKRDQAENEEDDDVNNNNKNSRTITAPENGSRPVGLSQFGMRLRSSSTRTTVGSSGEPTEHNSISISVNGDGTSGQGPNRKRFRPGSYVTGGNSAEAALPTNGAVVAAQARPKKKIDWDALDGPPELFDQNGDRESLVCLGGKQPKVRQLPPATYLWNIGSIPKVRETEGNRLNVTEFNIVRRLYRRLDQKDRETFNFNTGDCPICTNENCLLVIPHCNCRQPCCHSCMFSHLEASYARRQSFLCPFCQQPPVRLYYNIKSTFDYRIWVVPKYVSYTALYPLIRAIGLFAFENSEVCGGDVNPLCRITYASFISTVMRTAEFEYRLKLDPKQLFRAFVYIHDLIPWNYSAAQCTLPLPLCDEQAQHDLERLKDFLGAELCYFYSTLNLPENFEMHKVKQMNRVLVQMRALVSTYDSVQDYFEKGKHFQNALINILPVDWTNNDDIYYFNIHVPKKIYTESLHFLNSRAPSLDTYIKRVIYTNLPSNSKLADPCLSRRDSRQIRTALLVASNKRLDAKLAAYEAREREAEDQHQQNRLFQIMERLHRRGQNEANMEEDEDNEADNVINDRDEGLGDRAGNVVGGINLVRLRNNLRNGRFTPRRPWGVISSNHDAPLFNRPEAPSIAAVRTTVSRTDTATVPLSARSNVQPELLSASFQRVSAASRPRVGPSDLLDVIHRENESTTNSSRNGPAQSGEVSTVNRRTARFRVLQSNSIAANDEREIGLSSNPSANSRNIDSLFPMQEEFELPISIQREFFNRHIEHRLLSENENAIENLSDDSEYLANIYAESTHSESDSNRDANLSPTGSNEESPQPLSPGSSSDSSSSSSSEEDAGVAERRIERATMLRQLMGEMREVRQIVSRIRTNRSSPSTTTPAVNSATSTSRSSTVTASQTQPPSSDSVDDMDSDEDEETNPAVLSYALRRVRDIMDDPIRFNSNPSRGRRMLLNIIRNRPRPFSMARPPPIRSSSLGPTSPPVRPLLDDSESPVEPEFEIPPPPEGDEVEKLKTACRDKGPGYQYFMRQIYPEESDGDSDSDDEYITMRGDPSQWKRAKRSILLCNGSSPSGSTNQSDHIQSSSVSPGLSIASTSGINSRQQQDQVPNRDVASSSKVHLDSDSD